MPGRRPLLRPDRSNRKYGDSMLCGAPSRPDSRTEPHPDIQPIMKPNLRNRFVPILSLSLLVLFGGACSETPDNIAETIRGEAFSALSVTANNGETVQAVAIDEKNYSLAFDTADEFDKCSIHVSLNPGYTLIYPENPEQFDLGASPVIHFNNPQGRIIKYWLSVRSNSLPLVDASKISVEGSSTSDDVTLSSATKTLTVNYALGMDMTAITLIFGDGSLLDGGSVGTDNRATFDLSKGKDETLLVDMNGKQVAYTVQINFGRVMAAPSSIGMRDVTTQFVEEGSPFTVYQATSLPAVPILNEGQPEEPEFWTNGNYGNSLDAQLAAMSFLGDWASNRPTTVLNNQSLTVIFVDPQKVSGSIRADDAGGLEIDGSMADFVMTGCSKELQSEVVLEERIVDQKIKNLGKGYFRACVAFDREGGLHLTGAALAPDNLAPTDISQYREMAFVDPQYYGLLTDETMAEHFPQKAKYADYTSAWSFDAKCFATAYPRIIWDGNALRYQTSIANDGYGDSSGNGTAWNGERTRCFIGTTFDGRIAFAASNGKSGMLQIAWLLQKLGWRYMYYVGGSFYADDEFQPTIYLYGNRVCGAEYQTAKYLLTFDAKQ